MTAKKKGGAEAPPPSKVMPRILSTLIALIVFRVRFAPVTLRTTSGTDSNVLTIRLYSHGHVINLLSSYRHFNPPLRGEPKLPPLYV